MNVLSRAFESRTPVLPHVTWPITPHQDESLAGFVARTCDNNGLQNPSVLVADAGFRIPKGFGRLARAAGDLTALAALLAADLEWVESRRHRSLDKRRSGGTGLFVDFNGAKLRRAHLDYSLRRVAPSAIANQSYHREIWHVFTLAACATTGEILVEACQQPSCGKPFTWTGHRSMGRCTDPWCEGAVGAPAPLTVPDRDRAGLKLAAAIIHPLIPIHEPAVASLPKCLQQENRGDLFELAWLLGCLSHPDASCLIMQPASASPLTRTELLARGASQLLTWPVCVAEELRRCAAEDAGLALKKAVETLQGIVRKPMTFGRAALLLAGELGGISSNAFSSVVGEHLGLLTATKFAEAVSLKTSQMATLQRSKNLPRVLFSEGGRDIALFSPDGAKDIRRRIKGRVSAQAFGSDTGLGIDAVEQLVAENALELIIDPVIQTLWPEPHLEPTKAAFLVEGITRSLKDGPEPAGAVSLSTALHGCPAGEKPWPGIIEAVLAGRLSLHSMDTGKLSVRSCLISQQDVGRLHSLRASTVLPAARSEWLSEADARERLATTGRRLRSLVAAGRLSISGAFSGLTYRRSEIDAIASEWVSTLELQAKLRLTRAELAAALRAAGLTKDEHGLVPRSAARETLGLPLV